MPVRLSPLKQPGANAVLVGDPRRAFLLGQALTVQPEMSHLARGLWGYGGVTAGGLRLTVQATGIGGPSAVAVIADLAGLGLRRLVRLGTCVAVGDRPEPGSTFVIERAFGFDGTSRALVGSDQSRCKAELLEPDPDLFGALSSLAPTAAVASHDLVHRLAPVADPDASRSGTGPPAAPAPLRDLQTAATFAIAAKLGLSAAAVLIVVENRSGDRLGDPELESRFEEVGLAVLPALESPLSNPRVEG